MVAVNKVCIPQNSTIMEVVKNLYAILGTGIVFGPLVDVTY